MIKSDTRTRKPLTDMYIRTVKPGVRPIPLGDGKALSLVVMPTGARLWHYRFRIFGKENVFSIGAYPNISIAEARAARDAARQLVKMGVNPNHNRKAERLRAAYESVNTFAAVAKEWLDDKQSQWTASTYRQRRNLLESEVLPDIGSLPMRQVTSAHVYATVKRIAARAPQMGVMAMQCIGAIFRLAIVTMRAEVDVTYVLRNSIRAAPTRHKSTLAPLAIPAFFDALDRYSGHFATKAAIRLLWFTLARPGEVVGSRWEEFDLGNAVWTIPAERMKMRREHSVPLPRQAVELLRRLRAINPNSDFILPNRLEPRRRASQTILAKAFDSMGYVGKFSPHGVRATGRTILGEQGHPKDVLERQLAHQDKKHVRAYDQGDRLEARRVVMQGWADYLDGLRASGNVVNINYKG